MKAALAKFGRCVYDTWYGATAIFLVVSIVLFGLQMVNGCLSDVVPWPKGVHALIMMILALNVSVATIVSFVRRKWARALGQVIMLGASLVCPLSPNCQTVKLSQLPQLKQSLQVESV